jgi:hypothetical protein
MSVGRLNRFQIAIAGASVLSLGMFSGCSAPQLPESLTMAQWLAGDHHVHSRYSVAWNRDVDPPEPILGGHGLYPIPLNALMAEHYGLSWMVSTDHGGRNHSKVNLEEAYPNLLMSREVVPEVIQFYGVELNPPGADHASVIVPHGHDEADRLYQIESQFDRADAGPGGDDPARMIEALSTMRDFPDRPIVIANHPSRTAMGGARYGRTTPAELRAWNDAAPEVAIGMIGSPGHQAISIERDGSIKPAGGMGRGQYSSQPTLGGFDPMTAVIGGFWDSMLGEGRRWWITANSDSHVHWTDGGVDFWPGEYSKTFVYAENRSFEILAALRAGRVFVTTGDLISDLSVTVNSSSETAGLGETLSISRGSDVEVTIRVRDPDGNNAHGENPVVSRVDLIVGSTNLQFSDPDRDTNPSTYVARRFDPTNWTREGEYLTMSYRLEGVEDGIYIRVRGTNTGELEPEPDPTDEDPWTDLWFYSNPVFVVAN